MKKVIGKMKEKDNFDAIKPENYELIYVDVQKSEQEKQEQEIGLLRVMCWMPLFLTKSKQNCFLSLVEILSRSC